MTDLVLLTLARKWSGSRKSLQDSIELVRDHFVREIPGFNPDTFQAVNGSGLSSKGKISSKNIALILKYADQKRYAGRSLASLLPGSGVSWGLKTRLNRPSTAMHVRAKPGAINYGYGLGGYIHTKSGRKMAFAIVMSNDTKRQQFENNPNNRTRKEQQKVWNWTGIHRGAMDSTVARWVNSY